MPFILRRLACCAVAAWAALTANFFIPRAIPGNAVEAIMAKFPNLQPSAYKALEAMLRVGHPGSLLSRYGNYIVDGARQRATSDHADVDGNRRVLATAANAAARKKAPVHERTATRTAHCLQHAGIPRRQPGHGYVTRALMRP